MPEQEVKVGMDWHRKRGWVLIADAPLWLDHPTSLDILRPPAQGWQYPQCTDPPHQSLMKKMPLQVCFSVSIFLVVIPSSQRTQTCIELTNQLTRTPSSSLWCWEECLSVGFLPFSLLLLLLFFPHTLHQASTVLPLYSVHGHFVFQEVWHLSYQPVEENNSTTGERQKTQQRTRITVWSGLALCHPVILKYWGTVYLQKCFESLRVDLGPVCNGRGCLFQRSWIIRNRCYLDSYLVLNNFFYFELNYNSNRIWF